MRKTCAALTRAMVVACGFLGAAVAAPQPRAEPVSTIILNTWDFRPPGTLKKIKQLGFNNVTLYVAWRDVEAEKGAFDFSKYDALIDHIVANDLAVTIILNFGGGRYFTDEGTVTPEPVLPSWYWSDPERQDSLMKTGSGALTFQINFSDPSARKYIDRFMDQSVEHFAKKYGDRVFGFAIGLQEEHEIKYGQEGYDWRDFGDRFVADFKKRHGETPPIIDYNNEVAQTLPRHEPLYPSLQNDREADLIAATCHYASVIRAHQQPVIAYFGEIFTSHDGIYGLAAVEDLADCVDVAVIDFNFYDGWQLRPDADTLPMLANYLSNSGYTKIMVGGYGEQWARHNRVKELMPVVSASIARSLTNPSVIGYEMGGFYQPGDATRNGALDFDALDFDALDEINMNPVASGVIKNHPDVTVKVGLLASKSNFYFWHGEHSNDRNIHQDALTQAYVVLSQHPGVEVRVIGEKALRDQGQTLAGLDVLVVPHQIALPSDVKTMLKTYWESGGVLVQDLRLGEFTYDGQATGDWLHDVFGIAGVEWSSTPADFEYQGETLGLDMQGRTYANHVVLHPAAGHEARAKVIERVKLPWWRRLINRLLGKTAAMQTSATNGLVLRGLRTLVFGFLPQLVENETAKRWQGVFVDEILELVAEDGKKND